MTARLVLCALLLAACRVPQPDGEAVRVTIPQGASLGAIAETLVAHGIIDSPRRFRFYATLLGKDRKLGAGTYDLHRDRPLRDVLDALVAGVPALETLVIPEGLMLTEVAAVVEAQLGISADSFAAAARDPALIALVDSNAATLEGYLYPSTYAVRVGADAREVARQVVAEFIARWKPEWHARLDSLGLDRREVVILASIIEGEVRHDADRRFVASVYHNRLAAGWRLQADPTVIYALGRRRRLFERDYLTRSPYNTYRHDGLPPGPIGQPATASIEAALYPARTDFFFFVARPDGQHVFSRSLREHRAAIARIRGR